VTVSVQLQVLPKDIAAREERFEQIGAVGPTDETVLEFCSLETCPPFFLSPVFRQYRKRRNCLLLPLGSPGGSNPLESSAEQQGFSVGPNLQKVGVYRIALRVDISCPRLDSPILAQD
jgi:hypothetical protein